MAGTAIQVRVTGLDKLGLAGRQIEDLAEMPLDQLMDELGALGVSQTQERIDDQLGPPDGGNWAPLSEPYATRKREKSSGGLLQYRGDLETSLAHVAESDSTEWGSNLPYAAIQHFGGEGVGRPGHPGREYLGASPDNLADIERTIFLFIERNLPERVGR